MTKLTMLFKIGYGVFMTLDDGSKIIGQTKRLISKDYWGFFVSEK